MPTVGRAHASRSGARPAEHVLDGSTAHGAWDARLEPAAVIQSEDVVHVSCPPAADPALLERSSPEEIDVADLAVSLVGPIWVDGARPGDTLEVEVLEVRAASAGFTMIVPGLGLLPDDFAAQYLKVWDLREGRRARLTDGVSVPLAPFLGTMGTQPDEGEPSSVLPPHRGGGNIDNRYLTAGARLWLPIWCEGGRFSCGDGHAAQGDGEVCVSAIECGVEATLRFRLHVTTIAAPRFAAPAEPEPAGPVQATMGIADDLMEGARSATRAMIDWLADERGLSREDAFVLLSVAGSLKLLEVVDSGVWNVAMTLPLAVFE